jgi:hypothetical protein
MYRYKIKELANGNVDVYCKKIGFLSFWFYLFTADSEDTAQKAIRKTRSIEDGKMVVKSYEYP